MAIWLSHLVKNQRSSLDMICYHDLNLYLISLVLAASVVLSKLALNSRGYRSGLPHTVWFGYVWVCVTNKEEMEILHAALGFHGTDCNI